MRLTLARQAVLWVSASGVAALLCSGCAVPQVVDADGGDVGPHRVVATVDRTVALPAGGERLLGLTPSGDGLLGVVGPSDEGSGALVRVDTDEPDRSSVLSEIAVDAAYRDSAQGSAQIRSGWSISAAPRYGSDSVVISSGTRYGIATDAMKLTQPKGFAGVVTDKKGSPTGPVTGVCVDPAGTDPEQAATWTVSGSDVIERRPFPTAVAAGKSPEVTMLASPMISLRKQQSKVAGAVGPGKPARFAATDTLAVGGLRGLSCVTPDQAAGLIGNSALSDALPKGTFRNSTAPMLISVVDRDLAQGWFDRGWQSDPTSEHYGEHYSMGLVGQPTQTGPNRLDAVLVDSASGAVTAGIHLQGPSVPTDAQITALALDADGEGAWVAIEGSRELRHTHFDLG